MHRNAQPNVSWLLAHAKYIATIIFAGFLAGLIIGEVFSFIPPLRGLASAISGTLQYTGIVTAVLYVLSVNRTRSNLQPHTS